MVFYFVFCYSFVYQRALLQMLLL
ncbi:hypothetical protein EC900091_4358, partial [Escherichia coli 90.0091]